MVWVGRTLKTLHLHLPFCVQGCHTVDQDAWGPGHLEHLQGWGIPIVSGLPVPDQLHASHHDPWNVRNSFQMSNVNLSFGLLSFILVLFFRNDVRGQSPSFLFEQDNG